MDELAFFFSDDPASTRSSSPSKNAFTKVGSKNGKLTIKINRSLENNTHVFRNNSDPTFSPHATTQSIHVSGSFPDGSSLPLDLPPEPEEGNIEYKVGNFIKK